MGRPALLMAGLESGCLDSGGPPFSPRSSFFQIKSPKAASMASSPAPASLPASSSFRYALISSVSDSFCYEEVVVRAVTIAGSASPGRGRVGWAVAAVAFVRPVSRATVGRSPPSSSPASAALALSIAGIPRVRRGSDALEAAGVPAACSARGVGPGWAEVGFSSAASRCRPAGPARRPACRRGCRCPSPRPACPRCCPSSGCRARSQPTTGAIHRACWAGPGRSSSLRTRRCRSFHPRASPAFSAP